MSPLQGYNNHDSKRYASHKQPNAEETQDDQDDRENTSERQDYLDQLGDTSHQFENSPRLQGFHKSQSMKDVEEPTMYKSASG